MYYVFKKQNNYANYVCMTNICELDSKIKEILIKWQTYEQIHKMKVYI